jgi:hypothetical protein
MSTAKIGSGRTARGQSIVEFAAVIPVFMLILAAMLEFGLAFSDRLTIGNATREGARIGAALVTGMSTSCTGDPAGVDITVVASMQNILESGGADVSLSNINQIRIFKANSSGRQIGGAVNVWRYTPGSGPDADPGTGTEVIDFSQQSSGWAACARSNASSSPDSIGVSIDYSYRLRTPLAALVELLGGSQAGTIPVVDTTVMALNPTD